MNYEKKVLLCPDSQEGIFTSVYEGWSWAVKGIDVAILIKEPENLELFCSYINISPDLEKAQKVAGTIRKRLGWYVYETLCYVAASGYEEKGTIILQVLVQALGKGGCGRQIMDKLTDPYVNLALKLRTRVWHELHRYYGFVRFSQRGSVLFGKITPENDLLSLLAPHFADRYPRENWILYDENRKKALLHPMGGPYTIRTGLKLQKTDIEKLDVMEEYEDLWRVFCKSISIRERENLHLQQQWLPLKFRSNMPEFDKK